MFKVSVALIAVVLVSFDPCRGADTEETMAPVIVTALSPPPDESGGSKVSQQRLLNLQVKSPDDLSGLSPNLVTLGSGERGLGSIASMRGLANSPTFTDPAVVYYVDGVPSSSSLLNAFDWHELASLNVWKGPQGIRFG